MWKNPYELQKKFEKLVKECCHYIICWNRIYIHVGKTLLTLRQKSIIILQKAAVMS